MPTTSSITIKDVAKLAGVSIATVSAVVNERTKKTPLSDKSRAKVLDAINQLNYQVNPHARVLRTGRSRTIGVIASDLTQPFTGESVRLVEHEASKRDYNFLLSDIQNNRERERFYLELFRRKRVDGILFIGASNERDGEVLKSIVQSGIPVVLTEREVPDGKVSCVLVDNEKGGFVATNHLIQRGHRRIGYLAGPKNNSITHQRYRGYLKALRANGQTEKIVEIAAGMGLEDGFAAMNRLLERSVAPTAIFAFNDMLALGAMRAIRDRNLRIPADMAIIGFDDIPMAAFSEPTLTTVRQPRADICGLGVKLLLDELEGKHPRGDHDRILLQPELILRHSA